MKIKLKDKKKLLPRWDSFCRLNTNDWEKLNAGRIVEIDKIPKPAIPYLEIIKKKEK